MLKILIFFVWIQSYFAIEIREDSLKDVNGVSGEKVEIFCQVDDLRDPLDECYWYSPNGDKYTGDQDKHQQQRVHVEIDDRRDECVLVISRLDVSDQGAWECVAYEGRNEASKFAVIRVTSQNEPLKLLLDPGEQQIDVERGSDVQMICPTNHFGTAQNRPICKFYDPYDKLYIIVGKFGQIADYEEDRIFHAGDFENGECGIIIRDIDYDHSGTWRCEVLRKQRPGTSIPGSEITTTTFKVDVFRTSRLIDDDTEFQGYREDDTNVEIIMTVEVDESKEEFTDFFWLIRKSAKVYEGEKECLGSGRNSNCYEARRRRKIDTQNQITTYELSLEIDTLENSDITNKLYLVKDYREFRSKVDKFQVLVVPPNRPEKLDTSNQSGGRQRFINGQGCYIQQEYVGIGENVEVPELCVMLLCQSNGNVDVRSLSESKCRRRRTSRILE